MGQIVMGGRASAVTHATLELYHLDADEADWNLELTVAGPVPRVLLSGVVATPPLPGPSVLHLHFVDDPMEVVVDGHEGMLTSHPDGTVVELRGVEGGARVEGTLRLVWNALVEGLGEASTRAYAIELAVDVDVTTP